MIRGSSCACRSEPVQRQRNGDNDRHQQIAQENTEHDRPQGSRGGVKDDDRDDGAPGVGCIQFGGPPIERQRFAAIEAEEAVSAEIDATPAPLTRGPGDFVTGLQHIRFLYYVGFRHHFSFRSADTPASGAGPVHCGRRIMAAMHGASVTAR